MTARFLQVLLFAFWPAIALMLILCVVFALAMAWLLIPLGTPTKEGNAWLLKFPWSDK